MLHHRRGRHQGRWRSRCIRWRRHLVLIVPLRSVVLQEDVVLPGLFPGTLQLLLDDALLIRDLGQFGGIGFIQFTTRLLGLSLLRVEELFRLPELSDFGLKVLQLISEHRILLRQPLIVGVVHLPVLVTDKVLRRNRGSWLQGENGNFPSSLCNRSRRWTRWQRSSCWHPPLRLVHSTRHCLGTWRLSHYRLLGLLTHWPWSHVRLLLLLERWTIHAVLPLEGLLVHSLSTNPLSLGINGTAHLLALLFPLFLLDQVFQEQRLFLIGICSSWSCGISWIRWRWNGIRRRRWLLLLLWASSHYHLLTWWSLLLDLLLSHHIRILTLRWASHSIRLCDHHPQLATTSHLMLLGIRIDHTHVLHTRLIGVLIANDRRIRKLDLVIRRDDSCDTV